MIKKCPRCSNKTYYQVSSTVCEIKKIGNTTTGCGKVDFEVWKCLNENCPSYNKKQTRNIPCKCVKRHDDAGK